MHDVARHEKFPALQFWQVLAISEPMPHVGKTLQRQMYERQAVFTQRSKRDRALILEARANRTVSLRVVAMCSNNI